MFGVWRLAFGVWRLVFGVWCLVFGVWCWVLENVEYLKAQILQKEIDKIN